MARIAWRSEVNRMGLSLVAGLSVDWRPIIKAQNGQHITLVGSLHCVENVSVENVTIYGDKLPQEEHQQMTKKAQHPNTARSAISGPTPDKQRVFLIRRAYHVGNRVIHFAAEVRHDNPDRDKVEITFTDTNGDSITTWYPRPGQGCLSSRWYNEELIYDRGEDHETWFCKS